MNPDPFLGKVSRLAWRIDDPRALEHLWHENDPSPTHREQAIGERARKAGWPDENIARSRKAATTATQRLEGMDWHHRAQSRRSYQRQAVVAAYESRRRGAVTTTRGGVLPVEEDDTGGYNRDDSPGTIFDE